MTDLTNYGDDQSEQMINQGPPKEETWKQISNLERNAHVHHCGPIYYQRVNDKAEKKFRMAMRVLPHNMNYAGVIHGGALMTLADFALSSAGMKDKNDNITTVQFNCQFVAGAPLGAWITSDVDSILKKSLGFHEGKISMGDQVLLLFSGVTKRLVKPIPENNQTSQ